MVRLICGRSNLLRTRAAADIIAHPILEMKLTAITRTPYISLASKSGLTATLRSFSTLNKENEHENRSAWIDFFERRKLIHQRELATNLPAANPGAASTSRSFSILSKENEPESKFTWADFFEMRKSMRRWELATGIITAAVSFFGSCFYLFTIASFDPTDQFFGIIDSYTLYIILPGFIAVLSYVAGLAGGSSLWRLSRDKNILPTIDKFNKNFYDRITNNRAPEAAIVSPIPKMSSPDYYGEKIFSPNDYRKWLKKQRVLSKRRQEAEKAYK